MLWLETSAFAGLVRAGAIAVHVQPSYRYGDPHTEGKHATRFEQLPAAKSLRGIDQDHAYHQRTESIGQNIV
jgi:hypothetical protein